MGVVLKYTVRMKQVVISVSLLLSHSLSSPLVPGLSLLQDDAMMGDMMGDMMEGAGAAMDMSDMTTMVAGAPALMLLSTFLPGLAIGVLKGMLFSVLLDKMEEKPRRGQSQYQNRYPRQGSLRLAKNYL